MIENSFFINKKILFVFSLLNLILFYPKTEVFAETFETEELPLQNLECFDADLERFKVNQYVDYSTHYGNLDTPIKRSCMGFFPNFPSTTVEGGLEPFYYAKFRFFPEPMPIYTVTTIEDPLVEDGFYQTFELDRRFETLPGDNSVDVDSLEPHPDDLFLLYPYNYTHTTFNNNINTDIKGPYQAGYNSYYHNLYRGRYFPKNVEFRFFLVQPDRNNEIPTEEELLSDPEGIIGDVVFSGTINYEMPNECFLEDVLDIAEHCREIEFYFPKEQFDIASYSYEDSELSLDNKKQIADERLTYKNPGVHILKFVALEHAEYRYQVDEGYDWQTDPFTSDWSPIKPANIYTSGIPSHLLGRGFDVVPHHIDPEHFEYVPLAPDSRSITSVAHLNNATLNEGLKRHVNFCDINTDSFNREDENAYEDKKDANYKNSTSNGSPYTEGQTIDYTNCFHNANSEYHFWEYNWSTVRWYRTDLN